MNPALEVSSTPSDEDAKPNAFTTPYEGKAAVLHKTAVLSLTIIPFIVFIGAVIYYWGEGISLMSLLLLVGFYAITTMGIGVGYHRLFTHKGFQVKPWLKAVLALAGAFAIQGQVIRWVADHRRHHAFSDRPGDPHSPHIHEGETWIDMIKGFWYAHIGWFFDQEETTASRFAPDLLKDKMLVWIDKQYGWWILLSFLLPGLLGWLITMSWTGFVEGLIWGGAVRVFFLHHVTWSINSVCHVFGSRPYKTRDLSRNNFIFGVLAFGEGWHNNHHAFPAAAVHGFRWWQIDINGLAIWVFEKLGWVWNVNRATASQKQSAHVTH
ncbi:MAG: acyl-CoA desaturase [Bacteroidota bacterium]